MSTQARIDSLLECYAKLGYTAMAEPPVDDTEIQLEEDEDELPPPVTRDPNLVSPLEMFRAGKVRRQQARMQQEAGTPSAPKADYVFTCADGEIVEFTFDNRKGQPAPMGVKFVPFGAVARYCYKYIHFKNWSMVQEIATAFFDQDQIYSRTWQFYYLPSSDYNNALAFVTEHQFQGLIDEINTEFPNAKLNIHEDVIIDFEDLPSNLRPRWAGPCNSRSKYNSLINQITTEPDMVLPASSDRSFEAFKAQMQAAADANRAKGKKAKAFKKQEVLVKRQGMVKEALRAQRYLGLLPRNESSDVPDISKLSIDAVDVAQPAPHPFDNEPIFIAIDAEAYEHPPRVVTEVGVATLDTRDLNGQAPGTFGQDWRKHIRARHFRISDYKNYVNRDFVLGCPNNFEFGDSEFITKDTVASALASCFREPFSKKSTGKVGIDGEQEQRNIVLVGHDLGQDVNYCHSIGFSVLNRGNLLDNIDTVNLYRSYTKDPNATSLGNTISKFGIAGWHLHNAGNDAVYTLQAMLAICVASASERGSEEAAKKQAEDLEKRTQAQIDMAKERAQDDAEGWSPPAGDDGGAPLTPTEEAFIPKSKGGNKNKGGSGASMLYTMGGAPLDV